MAGIASAAAIFALWRRPWRAFARLDRRGRRIAHRLGIVLAFMNCCFYISIARLPLGTVAAIEFLPVILLAAAAARTVRNALALTLAVAGVYVLTDVRLEGEPIGVAFAFANAVLFALYIVLGTPRGPARDRRAASTGSAASMLVAAAVVTPIGGWAAAPSLLDPAALAAGTGVGIASSVIPYVADQLAMAKARARDLCPDGVALASDRDRHRHRRPGPDPDTGRGGGRRPRRRRRRPSPRAPGEPMRCVPSIEPTARRPRVS